MTAVDWILAAILTGLVLAMLTATTVGAFPELPCKAGWHRWGRMPVLRPPNPGISWEIHCSRCDLPRDHQRGVAE